MKQASKRTHTDTHTHIYIHADTRICLFDDDEDEVFLVMFSSIWSNTGGFVVSNFMLQVEYHSFFFYIHEHKACIKFCLKKVLIPVVILMEIICPVTGTALLFRMRFPVRAYLLLSFLTSFLSSVRSADPSWEPRSTPHWTDPTFTHRLMGEQLGQGPLWWELSCRISGPRTGLKRSSRPGEQAWGGENSSIWSSKEVRRWRRVGEEEAQLAEFLIYFSVIILSYYLHICKLISTVILYFGSTLSNRSLHDHKPAVCPFMNHN